MKTNQDFTNIKVLIKLNGREFIFRVSGKVIYDDNKNIRGYRGVGSDITQSEIMKKVEADNQRHERAAEITSALSHDLNNILNVIAIRLENINLNKDTNQQDQDKSLKDIIETIFRASTTARRMLDYSKYKIFEAEYFDTIDVIKNIHQEMSSEFHDIDIDLLYSENDTIYLKTDKTLFYNALRSILNNAIRAVNYSGKIYLSMRVLLDMDLKAYKHLNLKPGNYIKISIEDTGPGFLEDELEYALEPFFTKYHDEGGTGLGLSMVKGFAVQSKGTITLSNGLYGAEVSLYLPIYFYKDQSIIYPNIKPNIDHIQ